MGRQRAVSTPPPHSLPSRRVQLCVRSGLLFHASILYRSHGSVCEMRLGVVFRPLAGHSCGPACAACCVECVTAITHVTNRTSPSGWAGVGVRTPAAHTRKGLLNPGFVHEELTRKGEGDVWVGPTKGRLFKLDLPSAKFWVNIFWGVVGLGAKRPPPPLLINKVCLDRHVCGVWSPVCPHKEKTCLSGWVFHSLCICGGTTQNQFLWLLGSDWWPWQRQAGASEKD